MRARRAGTPARAHDRRPDGRNRGAPEARRSWQRLYRCLLRAQPGPERSGGTRPTPPLPFAVPPDPPRRETGLLAAEEVADAGAVGGAGGELGAALHQEDVLALEPGLDLLDAVDAGDCRAVDAH